MSLRLKRDCHVQHPAPPPDAPVSEEVGSKSPDFVLVTASWQGVQTHEASADLTQRSGTVAAHLRLDQDIVKQGREFALDLLWSGTSVLS